MRYDSEDIDGDVRMDTTDSPLHEVIDSLGSINSSSLFGENGEIRADARENEDYILINSECWSRLVKWYNIHDPIERHMLSRFVIGDAASPRIEVFRLLFKVTHVFSVAM